MSTTYPSSLSGATIAPSISSAPTASPSPAPSKYNPSSNNTSTFTFPREHSFPPFYTLQPTLTTRHAQLLKWSSLILSYCRHFRIYKLSLVDAVESDLFYNKRIGKKLGINDLREVLEFMRKDGRIERVGAGKEIGVGRGEEGGLVWVWWRTPEEWAGALYDWVDETAQKNTVLTLYELTESEATLSQEFHGMDPELLQRALNILVKRGKAQVFGQEDQQGVKFF